LYLAENARFVLTDSGGLQEEATFFRTPCLTLRPNTERPITVTIGSNRLTTTEALRSDIATLLSRPVKFGEIPPLWDGHTGERIVQVLLQKNRNGSIADKKHKREKQPVPC
jgi:UDP-N-acetylglucosamine 2-epimerase (non-hydrolysing)